MALAFLNAIKDHRHSGGVTGEDLQQLLGVKHPKGVGSRLGIINTYLTKTGFDPAKVYTKVRDKFGARHWNAGPELDSVIDVLTLI